LLIPAQACKQPAALHWQAQKRRLLQQADLQLHSIAKLTPPDLFFHPYQPADYRMIQQAMLDMENMFELLGQQPELQVRCGAVLLVQCGGGNGSALRL
jgi:hypothetical protein